MPAPPESPLAYLVGSWAGEGRGMWTAGFRYLEWVDFEQPGAAFVSYRQRTAAADGSRPLHAESGYLRPKPGGVLEAVVAQPTGIVEVLEGTFEGQSLKLQTTFVGRTPTALAVTAVRREIEVTGDVLTYRLAIAMNDEPLAAHLEGRLLRA